MKPQTPLLWILCLFAFSCLAPDSSAFLPFFKKKKKPEPQPIPRAIPIPQPAPAPPRPAPTPRPAPKPAPKPASEASAKPTAKDNPRPDDLPKTSPAPNLYGWANEPPKDFETHLRIQIFLDRNNFGPGKIDGAIGQFSRKAAAFYNRSKSLKETDWGPIRKAAAEQVPNLYHAYRVKEGDLGHVNKELPYEKEKQIEEDAMDYRSVAELISERYHTTPSTLKRLNPKKNVYALKPGDLVVVPNVRPFVIESVGRDKQYPSASGLSERVVVVDTALRMATFHYATPESAPYAAFPITPGKAQYIPWGVWKVKIMITTPEFRYDKKMLEEGERGDEFHMIPRGPNSPVGIFWAGLTKSGIGLHGTSSPETIGRSQSAGCIRLANWDAIRLPALMRPGATVIVK